VRLTHVGVLALAFTFGCMRAGYDALPAPSDSGSAGASADDGGSPDAAHPSDAGSLDDAGRAGSDAEVDSGPADLCPASDAVFCDGFEDTEFQNWSYPIMQNGTAVQATDGKYVRSGVGSLHATTGPAAPNTSARYGVRAFDHQKSGEIWLRSYYYIPKSTVADPAFSTCVVAEVEPPYFGFSLLVLPTRVAIGVGSTRHPGTLEFRRDRWVCVELHVRIAASGGVFEAYLDGALAARSPAMDTVPDRGYTTLDVGIHYTDPAQGPVEVYVDDVVADTTRVGCE
jgi:hypothetical protein